MADAAISTRGWEIPELHAAPRENQPCQLAIRLSQRDVIRKKEHEA